MMMWMAIVIALLVVGVIASVLGQHRISLKLLCALQSVEERVHRKREPAPDTGPPDQGASHPDNPAMREYVVHGTATAPMRARGAFRG